MEAKTKEQVERDLIAAFAGNPAKLNFPRISDRMEQFEKDLEGFDVCEWGSCQYYSAWVTYTFCRDMIKEIGLANFKSLIKIPEMPVRPIGLIMQDLKELIEDSNKSWTKEEDSDMIMHIEEPLTFTQYAELTKNNSWDLWSAYITFWQGFEIPEGFNPSEWEIPMRGSTIGPILNQMCQEENPMIGLSAAILEAIYPEFNPMDWEGYDT